MDETVSKIKEINKLREHYSKKGTLGTFKDVYKEGVDIIQKVEGEYKSLPRKTRWNISRGGMAILVFFFVALVFPYGHAEEAVFYPTSCLGGWNNPEHAQNKPETSSYADESTFTKDIAATLPPSTVSDLFCGQFAGEIPKSSEPKKIVLSFSWKVKYENTQAPTVVSSDNFASSSIQVLDATTTPTLIINDSTSTGSDVQNNSNQPQGTSLPNDTPTNTPEDTPATQPDTTPVPVDQSPQTFNSKDNIPFISTLFQKSKEFIVAATGISHAYAEETSTSSLSTDSSSTPVLPIDSTSSDIVTTEASSTMDTATTTETAITQQETTNPLFQILYTADGTTWTSLGTVDKEHITYATFEIPISAGHTWEDLSKIQIQVHALPSFDNNVTVYLDGMQLSVSYGDAENFVTKSGLYIPKAQSESDSLDFQIRNNGSFQELVVTSTSSMPLVWVVVFDNATGEIKLNTSSDDQKIIFQPEYFGKGKFTIISTKDPNLCSNETVVQCKQASQFQSAGWFEVADYADVVATTTPSSATSTSEIQPAINKESVPAEIKTIATSTEETATSSSSDTSL